MKKNVPAWEKPACPGEAECGFWAMVEKDGVSVTGYGLRFLLKRPADLETLWRELGEGEEMPYWAEVWPASLALAEWLLLNRRSISGKTCIDAGCGLGLTTLAAARLGANVLGFDRNPGALAFCRTNLVLDGGRASLACADWDSPPFASGCAGFIWAGDIMYERIFFRPLLDFFGRCLAPGGVVWIAEPGRSIFYAFLRLARQDNWQCAPVHTVMAAPLYPGQPDAKTRIWQLMRGII